MNSTSSETPTVISVIIPSYNQLEGLKKTVKAFSDLRVRGLELIVIDGASTDGSAEWIHTNFTEIDHFLV